MSFSMQSTAFSEGAVIPAKYTCDGADCSPPLQWSAPPEGTKTFALIMDDPDAPVGIWVHWVIYNIPSKETGLVEGIVTSEKLPNNARQGINDFRRTGYGGPCPPKGPRHRYFFKLYALDCVLDLPQHASKKALEEAMQGHVLGSAQLMGIYSR